MMRTRIREECNVKTGERPNASFVPQWGTCLPATGIWYRWVGTKSPSKTIEKMTNLLALFGAEAATQTTGAVGAVVSCGSFAAALEVIIQDAAIQGPSTPKILLLPNSS
jgi:hypothetical protein